MGTKTRTWLTQVCTWWFLPCVFGVVLTRCVTPRLPKVNPRFPAPLYL